MCVCAHVLHTHTGSTDVGNEEPDSSALVKFHLMNQFSSLDSLKKKKNQKKDIRGCDNGAEERRGKQA